MLRVHDAPDVHEVLSAHVRRLLRHGGVDVVTFDLREAVADLAAVDTLGRLQLTAKRMGGSIRLRSAPAHLAELIEFVGVPIV